MSTSPKLPPAPPPHLLAPPLRVWPGGTPLTWMVESRRKGTEPHQVHLGAYRGNGCCTCEHFVYRLRDRLEHGGEPPQPALRCGHILRARQALLDETIARLSKQEPCR